MLLLKLRVTCCLGGAAGVFWAGETAHDTAFLMDIGRRMLGVWVYGVNVLPVKGGVCRQFAGLFSIGHGAAGLASQFVW